MDRRYLPCITKFSNSNGRKELPRDTSASTYEVFDIRAVELAKNNFDIRDKCLIRVTGLAGLTVNGKEIPRKSFNRLCIRAI